MDSKRLIEAYPVPSAKVRLAGEAAALMAERKAVKVIAEDRSSSFSASEEKALDRRPWRERRVRRKGDSQSGKVEGDERTIAGYLEQETGMSLVRRVKKLSESYNSGEVVALVACCSQNVLAAVIEMKSFTM